MPEAPDAAVPPAPAGVRGPAVLLGPADVRRLARQAGLRPSKRLGQNFVVDANTVRRIVRAAALQSDDVVLEVGPGLGSLTLGLLPACARVVAVEIDPVLAAMLPSTVAGRCPGLAGRLEVLSMDALQLREIPGPPPGVLVANLPYNLAVPILLTLFERFQSVRRGLVMVQAEVADRLTAGPAEPAYGVPSVKAAWYAELRRAGPVPRAVFWPVPNVDSGLVTFTRRDPPAPGADARRDTFAVVDAAFAQRRKTLRAALAGWAGSADAAAGLLRRAGIEPVARGEQLSVGQFAELAAAGSAGEQARGREGPEAAIP